MAGFFYFLKYNLYLFVYEITHYFFVINNKKMIDFDDYQ